jgi:hypothetical protein
MNQDVTKFTIVSRSASRSDCPSFGYSPWQLGITPRQPGTSSPPSTPEALDLWLQASLAQLNCHHLRMHAQQLRELLIQYP